MTTEEQTIKDARELLVRPGILCSPLAESIARLLLAKVDEVERLKADVVYPETYRHPGERSQLCDHINELQANADAMEKALEFYAEGPDLDEVDDWEPAPEKPFRWGACARAALTAYRNQGEMGPSCNYCDTPNSCAGAGECQDADVRAKNTAYRSSKESERG